MYNFQLEKVVETIKKHQVKKVLIQLPDGLRPFALNIANRLESDTNAEIFLSGDSCYGACDLAIDQTKIIGANLLIHFGHSQIINTNDVDVIYVETFLKNLNLNNLIKEVVHFFKNWEKVGLTSTIQYIDQLGEVASSLEKKGVVTLIGEATEKTPNPGQVLGCYYETARSISDEVDGFLFIGSGHFHPLGLALVTKKPIVIFDPIFNKGFLFDECELLRLAKRRMAAIEAFKNVNKIGVVISTKIGQLQLESADIITQKFKKKSKQVFKIVMNEIRAEVLQNFIDVEAFIITGCPRIAFDGIPELYKPTITAKEALVVLNELDWATHWTNGDIL